MSVDVLVICWDMFRKGGVFSMMGNDIAIFICTIALIAMPFVSCYFGWIGVIIMGIGAAVIALIFSETRF